MDKIPRLLWVHHTLPIYEFCTVPVLPDELGCREFAISSSITERNFIFCSCRWFLLARKWFNKYPIIIPENPQKPSQRSTVFPPHLMIKQFYNIQQNFTRILIGKTPMRTFVPCIIASRMMGGLPSRQSWERGKIWKASAERRSFTLSSF